MDISTIIPHIEAIIFASDRPVTTIDLVELVNNAMGFMEDRAHLDQVESALDAIREKYDSDFYPFHVMQSGGGWQFLTKPTYHATVAQLNGQKFLKKLSSAALEVLSIIAYKQPVTKGEIEEIRGVNCDYAVQKLLEKDLVIITGRKENAPGQPLIYATSKTFMDYFGINSPADLPQLSDVTNQEVVNPTIVGASNRMDTDIPTDEEGPQYVVNESGKIIVTEEEDDKVIFVDPETGEFIENPAAETEEAEHASTDEASADEEAKDSGSAEIESDASENTAASDEAEVSTDVESAELESDASEESENEAEEDTAQEDDDESPSESEDEEDLSKR